MVDIRILQGHAVGSHGASAWRHAVRPTLVSADGGPWPLHDLASSRRVEGAALASNPPHALMARAGLATARLALALAPHAQRVLVLAGSGNNGGDGLVAARHLHEAGREVLVRHVGDLSSLPPDAQAAWSLARDNGVQTSPFDAGAHWHLQPQDIAIDALLGLGANRPPTGALAQAIAGLNNTPCTRLAIDIPSGLAPDTGTVAGEAAVRAHATLSLLTLKPGCFTADGRDHAGNVWWAPLGVDAAEPSAWLSGPALSATQASATGHSSHKGSFGDVLVVGGAQGMTGAAWLCAGAALAAGAGRVYLSLLAADKGSCGAAAELMLRDQGWQAPRALLQAMTVVCGSGGGEAVAATLPPLLAHAGRLVLDADALNAIAADAALRRQLQARGQRGQPTVLTPHPLEAARLLGCTTPEVQRDRLAAATRIASLFHGCAVLKGSGTVVAAPGRLPCINPTGNAALATAGTGDVLAGWTGGLWARRGGDATLDTAAEVATSACWLHGAAADRHRAQGQQGPLLAGKLAAAMAAAAALKG
jgi:hydroxyethylthiazole kinase-like uncharacterized protein yjeF